jgi:hypothetical protein
VTATRKGDLIPFGKNKNKPIETLAADPQALRLADGTALVQSPLPRHPHLVTLSCGHSTEIQKSLLKSIVVARSQRMRPHRPQKPSSPNACGAAMPNPVIPSASHCYR